MNFLYYFILPLTLVTLSLRYVAVLLSRQREKGAQVPGPKGIHQIVPSLKIAFFSK